MTKPKTAHARPESPPESAEPTTEDALRVIEEVTKQYERYVSLAKLNDVPDIAEIEAETYEPTTRPLGLVMDHTTPMGLHLDRNWDAAAQPVPSWNELLDEFNALADDAKGAYLVDKMGEALRDVSRLRKGRNVILYGSAFLQKPQAPAQLLQITHEDLNGYMSVMYGMDWSKGLTLILHTPGGVTNAAESLVAYIRSKFNYVEAIVPTLAMSAGTMMALSTKVVVMGRQSQLGPIDPQMPVGGRFVSARAVVEQFERAVTEIKGDVTAAHAWAPVLTTMGPALLQEAQNALDYGETMVARWLATSMFKGKPKPVENGAAVAAHFNDATTHKSHGRRIDRQEAGDKGVVTEELESSQELQEAVLTAYHLMTIMFEQGPAAKILWNSHGRTWLKNWIQQPIPVVPAQP